MMASGPREKVGMKSIFHLDGIYALKTILKLSKNGKDIFCRNSLVLSAQTSLEEILIEMDLEKWT